MSKRDGRVWCSKCGTDLAKVVPYGPFRRMKTMPAVRVIVDPSHPGSIELVCPTCGQQRRWRLVTIAP